MQIKVVVSDFDLEGKMYQLEIIYDEDTKQQMLGMDWNELIEMQITEFMKGLTGER